MSWVNDRSDKLSFLFCVFVLVVCGWLMAVIRSEKNRNPAAFVSGRRVTVSGFEKNSMVDSSKTSESPGKDVAGRRTGKVCLRSY